MKRQYPFGARRINMLCAGSGVTPMLQALRRLVAEPRDTTEVVPTLQPEPEPGPEPGP